MRLLKTRRQKVDHVEFSAAGALLAQGYDEVVCWENPTAGNVCFRVPARFTWGAGFVGFGNSFAVSSRLGVSIFRPSDGQHEQLSGLANRIYRAVVARGGRVLFHASGRPLVVFSVRSDGVFSRSWELPDDRFPSQPTFLNATDQFLRFESRSGQVFKLVIRNLTSGVLVEEWPVQPHTQQHAVISPDDHWLAFPSLNSIVILDLVTHRAQSAHLLTNLDKKHFTGLAFHPSGRYLAATSNDATVKLYDTSNWALATTFTWDVGRMRSVAFSPDGLLAAAGSDTGKVVVWDVDV